MHSMFAILRISSIRCYLRRIKKSLQNSECTIKKTIKQRLMKYKAVYPRTVTENNHLFSLLLVTFYASVHQRIVHFTTRSVIVRNIAFFSCPCSFLSPFLPGRFAMHAHAAKISSRSSHTFDRGRKFLFLHDCM